MKARVSVPFLGFVRGLVALVPAVAVLAGGAGPTACVPTGSAPPYDAGTSSTATPGFKPSINVMTQPFEDNFDRPDASEGEWAPFTPPSAAVSAPVPRKGADAAAILLLDAAADGTAGEGGLLALSGDAGDAGTLALGQKPDAGPSIPSNLGPNWVQVKTSAWRVENGKLCGQGAKNHPVWLNKTLPVNARIEFDAVTYSDDGDLKCEIWGDGQGYARGTSYTDATSYLAILGGWKNSLHVLARLNEHGEDRKVLPVDPTSDDPRQRPVVKGQVYRFKIERTDGKTVRFFVDGLEYHKWADQSPLAGQGHDHFGFNEWEARVCFDNVKVTPLP